MGADERDSNEVRDLFKSFAPTVIEKLDDGWQIIVGADDQMLLAPPPRYGEPDAAS